ncbi:OLC1v1016981C1 [Oldenlandia corymbosa var. corymbosa]|uniref:OLC1v1016981C1 n=1 Tax=Oldenlandia corymbosa var. corymbosa TaxID=529605 RepID=A0AAV1E8C6_OLDCO|nr:OLC1v1016981C1 [Oldenlandia corymbosa var. corymbosa]
MQNFREDSLLLSSPNLLCQEETVHDHDGVQDCFLSIGHHHQQDDDDEYVEMLLDRELNSSGNGLHNEEFTCNISASWIKEARLNAIQYIINSSLSLGFKIETTYLAVTYLDRFLSRRLIEDEKYWAVRLLAIACLSLAAKMEECRVPLLSEFPAQDYNFECNVIRRMELLVLDTLDWRMALATPFSFTYYFASKLCQSNPIRETVPRVIDILSATIKNVKMTYHTPSAIAAAATLLILDQRMTRESLVLKINTLSSCSNLKIDDIISVYNQMKESDILHNNRSIESPLISPLNLQSDNTIDNVGSSLITSSGVSAKRKSLNFNDENGQNSKRHNSRD